MQTTFGELLRLARRLADQAKTYTASTGLCHVCHQQPPDPHGLDPCRCRSCAEATNRMLAHRFHVHFAA